MALGWAVLACAWLAGVALQLMQAQLGSLGAWRFGVVGAVLCMGTSLAVLKWWPRASSWRHIFWLVAAVALGLLGWAQTQWRAEQRWHEQWPADWARQDMILTGQVVAMPQLQLWGLGLTVDVGTIEYGPMRCVAGQPWSTPGAPIGAHCPRRVSITWPVSGGGRGKQAGVRGKPVDLPDVRPGQVWRWRVRLHQPDGLFNPGGYDAELGQFERGVRAQGTVVRQKRGDPPSAALLSEPGWLDGTLIERWRTWLCDRIVAGIDDPQLAGLVMGLTIGEQSAIAPDDWDAMRQTGTAHLAAISGMHVTMMGLMVSWLVSTLWRRSARLTHWRPTPTVGRWFGLAGAAVYALLSGWGVPAQRTVLMLGVWTVLRSSGRRWPWPLGLLWSAVAVTVLDPWASLGAGFWLSFAAVGLLMVAGGDGPEADVDGQRWWQGLWRAARELARTQWVASIGLVPLSLVFFQGASVVGLVANLVCIPLFTVVITPLAMLGLAWPPMWAWLAPIVHHTMAALAWLGAQPWALWQSAEVVGWASALGLLAGAWMLTPLPWRWRLMAVPAMLPLLWPGPISQRWQAPPQGEVLLMAADIGQGTAVLVQTAHHALLFDTGPRTSPEMDAGRRVLVGLFRTMGIQQLDTLMLSHGDSDHIGGAASVLKAMTVSRLMSSLPAQHELLAVPDHRGAVPPHLPCLAGQRWQWDGVNLEVLHPSAEEYAQREHLGDNALSCVLRVEAGGRVALLTGDVEAPQEAALVARNPAALRAEVLVVPHHGSHTSSTDAFLAQVQPKVAVIQVGSRNRYGHPAPDVLARYQGLGIPIQASPDCGAWVWRSGHGPGVEQGQCWRDQVRRYWFHQTRAPASPDQVEP